VIRPEDLLVVGLVAAVIHSEQHGDVLGFVLGDVGIKPCERIPRLRPADTRVVKPHTLVGKSREEEVLDVLRVKALMRDAVAEKHDSVAVGKLHLRDGRLVVLGECRCRNDEQQHRRRKKCLHN
jgi:hypothetical protein